jgi:1,4-dihydroxy-6-naphthoate synthase
MTTTKIRLGISTCPNDTFAFHGILCGAIQVEGLEFQIELCDVQELNERLLRNEFDVAKASFHAALLLSHRYGVLSCGSAIGFGVGPLLLAAQPGLQPQQSLSLNDPIENWQSIVLCPGELTTATLLYRLFYPQLGQIHQVVFSEIMPALQEQRAGFGVCIHEGRFTWQEQGLSCVEDLGTRWERETQHPLPLGGILASFELGSDGLAKVHSAIYQSIQYGLTHREETLSSMRRWAQEFSDEVLFAHVDLYVNPWTVDLGDIGKSALDELFRRAVDVGAVSIDAPPLQIIHQE